MARVGLEALGECEKERERERNEGKLRGETFYSMKFHIAILSLILQIYAHHSLIHLLTYLLTYSMEHSPWEANRFAASQEIPAFYETRRFITAFTSAPPLPSLSQLEPVLTPHPTSWRSILILFFHICLGLPSGLFLSGFPTKNLYMPFSPPYALHAPPISFFSILSPEQYLMSSTDH